MSDQVAGGDNDAPPSSVDRTVDIRGFCFFPCNRNQEPHCCLTYCCCCCVIYNYEKYTNRWFFYFVGMWILQFVLGFVAGAKIELKFGRGQQKVVGAAVGTPAGTFMETPESSFMETSAILQLMPSTFMQMLLPHLLYTDGKQLYISGKQLYTNRRHLQQHLLNSDSADGLRQRFQGIRRATTDGGGQNSSFIEHATSSKLTKYTTLFSTEKRRKERDLAPGGAGAGGEKGGDAKSAEGAASGGDAKPAQGVASGGDAKPAEGSAASEEGKPAKDESPIQKMEDEVKEAEVVSEKVVKDLEQGKTVPGINDAFGIGTQILDAVHDIIRCWFACTYDPPLVVIATKGYDEFLEGKNRIGAAAVGAPQTAYGTVVDSK